MKKTRLKTALISAFLMAALLLSGCTGTQPAQTAKDTQPADTQGGTVTPAETQAPKNANNADDSGLNNMTALEVSKLMGNGINLGNTLEAYNHQAYLNGTDPTLAETVWGMPTTTREMIDGMKAAGFDTIRIPVAWTNGMNYEADDYTIDERLMQRVETVVNYALDADMFVIVNDHWDGSWWGMFGSASEETREKAMNMYRTMWRQIAGRFADYSYKLIFESANEELGDRLNDKDVAKDSGSLNTDECYETTNLINSEFVKLVRSTGGKNADRFLLIAGYNTDFSRTFDDRYKMPEDTAENKLFLSVHYYTPWDYCGTKAVQSWGSPKQYDEMNDLFKKLTKFTDKGYGVIIGEYGVLTDGGSKPKPDTDIYFTNLLNNCDMYNVVPVLWDCNGLYRRREGKIADETIAKLFLDRSYASQSSLEYERIIANAKAQMAEDYEFAQARMTDEGDIPATDDTAVAWIMYQAADYGIAYCVGNVYDPTNKSTGVKATNALITGEGQYTVSLDFSAAGIANGVNFSALGIYNGEKLFPGYIITIDSLKVNGEETELTGKPFTNSDDGKCTRVNLKNPWVSKPPDDARVADGDLEGISAQVWQIGDRKRITTIEVTFTYSAPVQ